MSRHRKNDFLTLVLTSLLMFTSIPSLAAPEAAEIPQSISTKPVLKKEEPDQKKSVQEDSLSVTPTAPPPAELGEDPLVATRRLAKNASFVGGGLVMGSISQFNVSENMLLFSLGQTHYREAQRATEWTFEFASSILYGGSYGYKWLHDLGGSYEPYSKISLGGLFSVNESFGTFVNWKRYQLRASYGFEDLFSMGRRVRCEGTIAYSGFGFALFLSGSYAF